MFGWVSQNADTPHRLSMHRSRMGIAMASPSKQKYKTVQAEPGITRRVTRSQSREVEERGLYGETRQGKGKKGNQGGKRAKEKQKQKH